MNKVNSGLYRPELTELPQVHSRLTFIYVEYCVISRDDGAITIKNKEGIVYIPAAAINVLMLGPGTKITERAMELLADCGDSVVWTGEHGIRFYASGRPLTHRANLLIQQALLVSNERLHLNVVRKMYAMRFPGEDVSKLTMQQLRGKEGARVRKIYKENSKNYSVPWTGRNYDPLDFQAGDPVNKALSAGNACLYGLAHSVIAALGCSPGLGFVHVGHERSFVYDIADLYKAEITIPLAFEIASEKIDDIGSEMRKRTRDRIVQKHILERMVKDIQYLLSEDNQVKDVDVVYLWDKKDKTVPNGISYGVDGVIFSQQEDDEK